MRIEFVHFADAHVGTEQYKSPTRYDDFARTYLGVVKYCVSNKVGFVVIAGDLLNSDDISALTHDQVHNGLQMLRQAGIPTVAVRGNHERVRGLSQPKLWLQSLAERGLLYLLDAELEPDGQVKLVPWDNEACSGSYVDLGRVRVVGFGWQGANTATMIRAMADSLASLPTDGVEYTVLVAHAAMAGYLPGYEGGLSYDQVAVLEPRVDYLALGHIHRSYQVSRRLLGGVSEPWIFNPGSLDTYAINEWEWDRGFFHVSVDTEATPRHTARLIRANCRPTHAVAVAVGGYTSPAELFGSVRAVLVSERDAFQKSRRSRARPIVQLTLTGSLRFDRRDLDFEALKQLVDEAFDPLVVLIKDHTTSTSFGTEGQDTSRLDRRQLELNALRDLWASDARYLPEAVDCARLTVHVKDLLLSGSGADKVAREIRQRFEALESRAEETSSAKNKTSFGTISPMPQVGVVE